MKSWREVDWRRGPVWQICRTLSQGFETIRQLLAGEEQEPWEIDDALEFYDELCGTALVVLQTYITTTISDVRRVSGAKFTKEELLKRCNPLIGDTTLTLAELCDTMANYYKHRDEWNRWAEANGSAARTIAGLKRAGLREHESFLCSPIIELLLGTTEVEDLTPLVDKLTAWRKALLAEIPR